jgi:molecular chaperone DnaK
MKKDAEVNAEADKKKKELVEAKNIAETLAYTAEKSLRDAGDKVPAEIKTEVENAITEARTAVAGGVLETIKEKTQALSNASQKIGEAMMKNQPATDTPPTETPPEAPNKEGEVRDAETS